MPSQRCQCGAAYRFPSAAIGKRAQCKKCGLVFVLEPDETSSIPLNGNVDWEEKPNGPVPKSIPAQDTVPSFHDDEPSPPLVETLPSRGYFHSALWTLLFPTEPRNLVTFVVLWAVLSLLFAVLSVIWLFSSLVSIWYAAFRLAVIESAAAGEEQIPDVGFTGDFLSDFIIPLLKWTGSWVVVQVPAFAWLSLAAFRGEIQLLDLLFSLPTNIGDVLNWAAGITSSGDRDMIVFFALLAAGVLLWPMVILCVTIGGFGTVLRVDLMVLTISKSILPYLATLIVIIASVALKVVIGQVISTGIGLGTGLGGAIGSATFQSVLMTGAMIYLDIVAMRMIGLYYHHFKHRFAWDWG